MTYLDTSALIKRFLAETGSHVVRRLLATGGTSATAKVAYAEVYAGLTRRHREGTFSADAYAQACRQFERDWQGYIRLELHDDILIRARKLIQRHTLRGFDAIHLASALSLRDAVGEDTMFVAADERLLQAARAERLQTLNPEVA